MKVILGIDGGGTYTRVAVMDIEGNLLADVKRSGGANIKKDPLAKENVLNAVYEALSKANCAPHRIVGATAGIAGYDSESDFAWISELVNIDGLQCQVQYVSDAVVANVGAFLFEPGIIAISGTGSIIFGITEAGQHIRNYDFGHYAGTAARFLSYHCVHKIIANETDDTDINLVSDVFKYFDVTDVSGLVGIFGGLSKAQIDKKLGNFAPAITTTALQGSRLAQQICTKAAADIVTGIKLVGACFESDTVLAALIGGVAKSEFVASKITEMLCVRNSSKQYQLIEPSVPPVIGAAMMAMRSVNERN